MNELRFDTRLRQTLSRDIETILELWCYGGWEFDGVAVVIWNELTYTENKTRGVWKKLLNKKSGKLGKRIWNRVRAMSFDIEQHFDVRNERMFDILQIIYDKTNPETHEVYTTLDEIINKIEKTVFGLWNVRFHKVD